MTCHCPGACQNVLQSPQGFYIPSLTTCLLEGLLLIKQAPTFLFPFSSPTWNVVTLHFVLEELFYLSSSFVKLWRAMYRKSYIPQNLHSWYRVDFLKKIFVKCMPQTNPSISFSSEGGMVHITHLAHTVTINLVC